MKKNKLFLYVLVLWLANTPFLTAQSTRLTDEILDTGTLTEQYNYIYDKSSTYNEFKVVKIARLNKFWKNAQDSLNLVRASLAESKTQINIQKGNLDSLNNTLSNTKQQLAEVTEEKDSISFLGAGIPKAVYQTLMWGVIALLILALVGALYKFKLSNQITARTRKDFEIVAAELDDFKKRTLENERKLRRELQTERNTVEDLKQKLGAQSR
ncbi:hypothetical protein QQ008_20295 [Fulvivirgaceae bacterium BMA10]|uniref:tRNA (Guanine-N1)-methyltransferase n=1 Tax=Splendidivirga corallicola TaxID=3051826 RepID=A0ABT8KSJ9_9BACT|nr:hypothetical protein [Fulvivirgaceae bacterium BMA10]